jgi:regulator of replication initiation timing
VEKYHDGLGGKMAQRADDILKMQIGTLVLQNAILTAENQSLKETIEKLEIFPHAESHTDNTRSKAI